MIKTLHIRVKDKHASLLDRMARDVNVVWNFLNELSYRSIKERSKWLSAYDLQKYTSGSSKLLSISSGTVDSICIEYEKSRRKAKKAKMSWRTSYGKRKSLGWIPMRATEYRLDNGQIKYYSNHFGIWDSYGLSNYKFKAGNFSQDSLGRWYINVCVEVESSITNGTKHIGIDLGLKDFATMSDGEGIPAAQLYRNAQDKLAIAQRANKKQRVKAIHAQIKNRRADALHKLSRRLVNENGAIFVGNVNAKALAKTKMAKSVNDAGWSMFREMLRYKAIGSGVIFEEVNEAYSTQVCSCCGAITASSPKGRANLRIREWTCVDCGEHHMRDVNAARNILATGLSRLAGGSQSVGSSQGGK